MEAGGVWDVYSIQRASSSSSSTGATESVEGKRPATLACWKFNVKKLEQKKNAAKPAEPLKICRRRQQLLQLGTTESLRVKFVRSSQLGSVHEELHQRRRQVVLGWVLCPDTERERERSWKKHNRDWACCNLDKHRYLCARAYLWVFCRIVLSGRAKNSCSRYVIFPRTDWLGLLRALILEPVALPAATYLRWSHLST